MVVMTAVALVAPSVATTSPCRYRIQVGHDHGVKPGNIVGHRQRSQAAQPPDRLDQDHQDNTVELPDDLSPKQLHTIRTARVCQRSLGLEVV